MNSQVRRLFWLVLAMFLTLGVAVTLIQFVDAASLYSDARNTRRLIQAAERDRGPIVVAGTPVAYSERLEDSRLYQRTYPEGPLYASITGYFSAMNLQATGLEGTENEVLEGESTELFAQRLRDLAAGRERRGGGVGLTINPQIQSAAAAGIGDRAGAAVALDTQTGAILGMYSSPSFDPNPLASLDTDVAAQAAQALEEDPARPLLNRAIGGDLYAPGSVFKILTSAAMLETGVKTDTVLPSPVSTTLPNSSHELFNIDQVECGTGEVTLAEAFARSCNTTFAIASENLPAGQLAEVTARFGFGTDLKVPLQVTPSQFPEQMDAAQLAMSSIGQYDVRVTPLQMAMVAQAVANDGELMHPYLIAEVLDASNQVTSTTKPSSLGRAVSADVANSLTEMMQQVVDQPYGSGQSMAISGVPVAAKTGTAETLEGSRTNAWAVAFAPADNPRIAVAVVVEGNDADPAPHGGEVAGPIARSLLESGLQ